MRRRIWASVAALALAAAGPRFGSEDRRDLLIVIDVSPSMRAAFAGKEVMPQAKSRAREMVRALNGTRRAACAKHAYAFAQKAHPMLLNAGYKALAVGIVGGQVAAVVDDGVGCAD